MERQTFYFYFATEKNLDAPFQAAKKISKAYIIRLLNQENVCEKLSMRSGPNTIYTSLSSSN